jgi:type I restriction enzyme S subunit
MIGGRAASDRITPGKCIISVGNPATALPSGWAWTLLSDLTDLGTGHTPSRKHPEYWDGDIPWIGIRDAGAHHGGEIHETMQHVTKLGLANSSARLLPKDTVCLSRTASVGYIVIMGTSMATSQDFVTWSCGQLLDPRFLTQALLAEGDEIRRFGEGSTHTTIYFPEVKAFHIGLPPIREQQRIVSKIDSLSEKSHRARDHLNHIPRLVEKYKQAALVAAFRGTLIGLSPKETNLPDPKCWELPTGWRWAPFPEVAEIASNLVKPETIPDLPHIAPDSVESGTGRLLPYRTIKEDKMISAKHRFKPGQVIYSKIRPYLRKAVIVDFEGACSADMYPLSPKHGVDGHFLLYWLISEQFAAFVLEHEGRTVLPKINQDGLNRTFFPYAPLPEQKEIVRHIQSSFKWIDRLSFETTSARKLVDHLDQTILAKAFRGELVPQDPNDVPASVLLERIRAGRQATPISRGRSEKKAPKKTIMLKPVGRRRRS